MKHLTNVFLLAATVSIITISCKNKDSVSGDPKVVLTSFFEKISKKDMDGAATLASKDSKSVLDMMKMGMEMAEKMKVNISTDKDPAQEFKDIKIGDAKIDGDKATVAIENIKKNISFDFPLIKEDGSWKVDFSMGTLMKMGMNMDNKNGGENNTAGGENNHPMSSDSLKQSLKKMDSLMKTIDPEKMKEAMKAMEKLKQQ